jgi:hypothetical protein
MCYAILRVTYKAATDQTFHTVETLAELDGKVAEIQQRPEVRKVQWFLLAGHVERVEIWQHTMHSPVPGDKSEEKYEVYVPPSLSQPAQGVARSGQEASRASDAD